MHDDLNALLNALQLQFADRLVTSIEKSIAPLRSFVAEPMQWGRRFCRIHG